MHIGLVCNEYPPAVHGGIGSFSHDLATGLKRRGHEITVVGVYQPNILSVANDIDEEIDDIRVIRLAPSPGWLPRQVRALMERQRLTTVLKREHARRPFDVIEAPEYGGWLAMGTPPGVPTVARLHGAQIYFDYELGRKGSSFGYWLEKRWLRRADYILAVSDYAGKKTLELANLPDRQYQVIYNAVDTARFSPSREVEIEPGLIVFANSILPKKGVEQLLEAMNSVCRENADAHLLLIGKNSRKLPDGSNYSDSLLSRLDPESRGRVRFSGWLKSRDDVLMYLRKAQVCCYPSHAEGLGIAPLEAMAVGAPVIFTKRGPGLEVIEDGVSGLTCDPYDAGDIARKILMILEQPDLGKRLGENARKRVLERFELEQWILSNEQTYQARLKP